MQTHLLNAILILAGASVLPQSVLAAGAEPRRKPASAGYHPPFADSGRNYPTNPPEYWKVEWFKRSQDLLDTYHPDLFYFDGGYLR